MQSLYSLKFDIINPAEFVFAHRNERLLQTDEYIDMKCDGGVFHPRNLNWKLVLVFDHIKCVIKLL